MYFPDQMELMSETSRSAKTTLLAKKKRLQRPISLFLEVGFEKSFTDICGHA